MKQRFDATGFFWNDPPGYRPEILGPMPPIPDTGWKTPTEFPNLSAAKSIAIDTETYDPELNEAGPGWARHKGHIVGVSLAVKNGPAWYFPIRHELEPEYNLDPQTVLRWLNDASVLNNNKPKLGANIMYDLGWLREEGVNVGGPFFDIQYAEPLLDSETPEVSLEALSQKYLGHGKQTDLLKEWAQSYYKSNDKNWRKDIYRCPPRLVGKYAEADAAQVIPILDAQWHALEARGARDLFRLECRLIPMLMAMRFRGAHVNLERAEKLQHELDARLVEKANAMADKYGVAFNPNSGAEIAQVFDSMGIDYPRTADDKPSFRKEWLEAQGYEITDDIVEFRKIHKVNSTFVKNYLLQKNVNGLIHCQFHPLKGEGGGARSGRLSSSDPNLQNVPVRTAEGKLVREAFTPRPGAKRQRKYDYSQIEYRLLAHFAVGPGSEEIRAAYNGDPDLDYHDKTIAMIREKTGVDMPRKPAKNINFGMIYGMGKDKLFRSLRALGVSAELAEELFTSYHVAVPFAKPTMEHFAKEIDETGMIRTLLGRVSDFPLWVPVEYDSEAKALPYEYAIHKYGPYIQRAYKHKGLNRKLQGSAADIMKAAMVALWESGILDYVGVPGLTVHDELDWEDELENPDDPAWKEVTRILEETTRISVPIRVDMDYGESWGAIK